jgi:enoyl-CoA hydratase/carnithine racemase
VNDEQPSLLASIEDGIATLTLNRPDKLNALSRPIIGEIVSTLDRLEADDTVRAVIFTGAGRAFCAGADLATEGQATFDYERRQVDDPSDSQQPVERDWGGVLTLRLYAFLKPLIAAVNGPAVGVGATMQLPMDIRIASTDAKFGFVFARIGIVPEAASSWFLPRLVGISTALEWNYSGRLVPATEAQERGLVRSLHKPASLLDDARELAHELTRFSAPVSVALTRQMMWRMLAADHPIEAHRLDTLAVFLRGQSADAREGVSAFLQKRPPRFPNRVSTDMPDLFADRPAQEY